jgi:hypothetical protein
MRLTRFLLVASLSSLPTFALNKFAVLEKVKAFADHIVEAGQGIVPAANKWVALIRNTTLPLIGVHMASAN